MIWSLYWRGYHDALNPGPNPSNKEPMLNAVVYPTNPKQADALLVKRALDPIDLPEFTEFWKSVTPEQRIELTTNARELVKV